MEIRIGKSARVCDVCGRGFSHEEKVRSVARFQEGTLVRQDFCMQCFLPEHTEQAFSAWVTKYLDPKVLDQQPPELYSPLQQLFFDLCSSEDRADLAKAYLAAQLLRRMKVFRLIKESDEADGEVRVTLFADRGGSRLIEVRDPSFTFAELDAARAALFAALRREDSDAPAPEGGGADAAPSEDHPDGECPESPSGGDGGDTNENGEG